MAAESVEARKPGRPKKIAEPDVTPEAPEPETVSSFVLTTNDIKVVEPLQEGYSVLTSPTGASTTVPDSIKDILIESGYSE